MGNPLVCVRPFPIPRRVNRYPFDFLQPHPLQHPDMPVRHRNRISVILAQVVAHVKDEDTAILQHVNRGPPYLDVEFAVLRAGRLTVEYVLGTVPP